MNKKGTYLVLLVAAMCVAAVFFLFWRWGRSGSGGGADNGGGKIAATAPGGVVAATSPTSMPEDYVDLCGAVEIMALARSSPAESEEWKKQREIMVERLGLGSATVFSNDYIFGDFHLAGQVVAEDGVDVGKLSISYRKDRADRGENEPDRDDDYGNLEFVDGRFDTKFANVMGLWLTFKADGYYEKQVMFSFPVSREEIGQTTGRLMVRGTGRQIKADDEEQKPSPIVVEVWPEVKKILKKVATSYKPVEEKDVLRELMPFLSAYERIPVRDFDLSNIRVVLEKKGKPTILNYSTGELEFKPDGSGKVLDVSKARRHSDSSLVKAKDISGGIDLPKTAIYILPDRDAAGKIVVKKIQRKKVTDIVMLEPYPSRVVLRSNVPGTGFIRFHTTGRIREAPQDGYEPELVLTAEELSDEGTGFYVHIDGKYGQGGLGFRKINDDGSVVIYVGIGFQPDGSRNLETEDR